MFAVTMKFSYALYDTCLFLEFPEVLTKELGRLKFVMRRILEPSSRCFGAVLSSHTLSSKCTGSACDSSYI